MVSDVIEHNNAVLIYEDTKNVLHFSKNYKQFTKTYLVLFIFKWNIVLLL